MEMPPRPFQPVLRHLQHHHAQPLADYEKQQNRDWIRWLVLSYRDMKRVNKKQTDVAILFAQLCLPRIIKDEILPCRLTHQQREAVVVVVAKTMEAAFGLGRMRWKINNRWKEWLGEKESAEARKAIIESFDRTVAELNSQIKLKPRRQERVDAIRARAAEIFKP